MDLTLTDEQQLIADTARELLEARCPASHVRAMAKDPAGYSDELWKEMVGLGWTGLALPEDHGGAGAGFLDLCLVIEQMGRVQLPSPFVATTVSCARPITRFGTGEQRDAHLGPIAAGERIMTYAGAGPHGQWDPTETGITATPTATGWRLDGTSAFVPYAEAADDLLVVAHRDGAPADALVALLVDADAPGITAERLDTVGNDRQHRVTFDGVEVAGDAVLGDADDGLAVARAAVADTTAALCAGMVGGAQRVLDLTVDYASDRQQFGRPVGSFQAVQHHCANMAIDVLGARFLTYEAIWRLGEGLDADTEVSMAKAWTSDAYKRVCALGHQVHGAIGFTEEYDLHLYFRHATDAELTLGDGDHHRERIARHLAL